MPERRLGFVRQEYDRMVFSTYPSPDHNAMLDPATVDITGRILEMLGLRYDKNHPAVNEGDPVHRHEQEPDGSWFGRWGGTISTGPAGAAGSGAMEIDHHEPYVQQAAEWIRMVQNPDGGWGETVAPTDDPNTKGVDRATPSQTAWGILGLLAAKDTAATAGSRHRLSCALAEKGLAPGTSPISPARVFPRVFY